jgi:signal transduction histidine kinase/ActR/RegA family two-component response regulator
MTASILEPAVRREQLRAVIANLPQSVLATAFASIALAYLLHPLVPWARSIPWIVALNLVGMLRLLLVRKHSRRPADDPAQDQLSHWITGCAVASGILWAMAPWVLAAAGPLHLQATVLFSCLAIATGGAFGAVAQRPTAVAILLLPLLGAALSALLGESRFHHVLGVMIAVYAMIVARIVLVLHGQIREQIVLRFENAALLDSLARRTEEAEAANAAKSEFLAAASHDLRQPMHAIGLLIRSLLGRTLPEDSRALVYRIERSVDAMESLFDALFDISRLDSGAIKVDRRPFQLATLFDRLEQEFEPLATEKGIAVEIRATRAWVDSDAVLLDRILRNLLANAVHFTDRGGVLLAARRRGTDWSIEVWDTGIGIPEHEQRAVFREFHQIGNPARDRRRGLGLGLAIVDRLARLLDHAIELRSRAGRGTSVRVRVPAAVPAAAPVLPLQPPTADGLAATEPLVVVVEDDIDVLDATAGLLQQWGCEVVAAISSRSAMRQLSQIARRPDLLICDFRLVESRNGVQVIKRLREWLGELVPAIVITGDLEGSALALKQGDGLEVLRKPVSPDRLRQVVLAALRRRAAGMAASGEAPH